MIRIITGKTYRKMVQEIESQKAEIKKLTGILDQLQAAHEKLHRVYNDLYKLHGQSLEEMQNLINKNKKLEHQQAELKAKKHEKKA